MTDVRRALARWVPAVVVLLAVLAACGGDDGDRQTALDACRAEAARVADASLDAVDLGGIDGAVRVDDGWGFSGTVVTTPHERSFVCEYVGGQAQVTIGGA